MRRAKLVLVLDVEMGDRDGELDSYDYAEALSTIKEFYVYDLALYEHNPKVETFSDLLNDIKHEYQLKYGQA